MDIKFDKSSDWNAGGKRRNPLIVALLALVVLVLMALVIRQVGRLGGPRREVWVASGPLRAGAVVRPENLERRTVRERQLPPGAVADRAAIEGRRVARDLRPGEPLVAGDLAPARVPAARARKLAELLPPGRVLATVRVEIASIIMDELAFGDRFEIIAAGPNPRGPSSRVVASDAYFVAWIDPALLAGGGRAPERGEGVLSSLLAMPAPAGGGGVTTSSTRLLLGLFPQDVLPVTEAQAAGTRLHVVLHGRREVEQGELLAVSPGKSREVELYAGDELEKVVVESRRR